MIAKSDESYFPQVKSKMVLAPESEAKVIATEPLLDSEAVWTKLVKKVYLDPKGVTRTWESAERRTRPQASGIDGVGIVAILEKPTGPEVVLQKQYRPPLDKIVVELPAGLIDEGETAEEAAVRELKEETGYVCEVIESSPVMFNDPGFTNTNLKMVHVSIDMSLPQNQNLEPDLEENEFIEVFHVKLVNLWEECIRLEAEGYAIDARIANLAEGIEIAKKFKL
ncbi:putative ADP-ribose pyrophosphatase [Triangularia setosa]|uniref:ADP-ribose pyrophosphatase n=1 Tax=Triangularia setosa TaxID=2587417 RepID=A0AAN6VXL3_9PEZI|nr:putative ADP-ribose pyrophosphatase [Podospora setosa]